MYGTLGYLAGTAAGTILGPLVGTSAMGAFDEWHQQFVPRRSMDVRDWMADSVGAILGVGIAAFRRRRRAPLSDSRTDQLR